MAVESIEKTIIKARDDGVGYIAAYERFISRPLNKGTIDGSDEKKRLRILDRIYAHGIDMAEVERQVDEAFDNGAPLDRVMDDFCLIPLGAGNLTNTEADKIKELVNRIYRERKNGSGKRDKGRKTWNHAQWGDEFMDAYHVCYIDGTIAVWRDDGYQLGRDELMRAMVEQWAGIKMHQRREVESYLALKAPRFKQTEETDKLIAFNNGVLNIDTMELRENTPDLHIPNVIPHHWNPKAKCDDVDVAIEAWACGNVRRVSLIAESFGMAMYRGKMQQSPYFNGDGGSGKSTCLEAMIDMVGHENAASLDITHVGRRFQSVALMGKCANIADDVSLEGLTKDEMSVLKRCITKNTIEYEHKGGETGRFRPYATQIFSGNGIPRFPEAGRQVTRRFVVIPFEADFTTPTMGNQSKNGQSIESRLHTETALERFIAIGITALRDMLRRGGKMTVADDADQRKRDMLIAASSVAAFAFDALQFETEDYVSVVGQKTEDVYARYKRYCEEVGRRPAARNNFSNELCNLLKLDTKRMRHHRPSGGTQMVATFVKRK